MCEGPCILMRLTLRVGCWSVEIVGLSIFGTRAWLGCVKRTQIRELVSQELMSTLLQLHLIIGAQLAMKDTRSSLFFYNQSKFYMSAIGLGPLFEDFRQRSAFVFAAKRSQMTYTTNVSMMVKYQETRMRRCLLQNGLQRVFNGWLRDYTSEILNYKEASTKHRHQMLLFPWTCAEMTLQHLHAEISVSKWKQRRDHGWQETQ